MIAISPKRFKILLVEDDSTLRQALVSSLCDRGYAVETAIDGQHALEKTASTRPDLIVLDIMMPRMNGFEVTTELRRQGNQVPIVILSARMDTRDKVRGLQLGADDYVSKPFAIDELVARIERRLGSNKSQEVGFGEFRYDLKARLLFRGDQMIELSKREKLLLEIMLQNVNRVLSRDQIIGAVWGLDYEGTDRTVDNFIVKLRRKLDGGFVRTERGLGYRFVTEL